MTSTVRQSSQITVTEQQREEGIRYAQELEARFNQAQDANEILNLTGKVFELANHAYEQLPPEEAACLQEDLGEIADVINSDQTDEISTELEELGLDDDYKSEDSDGDQSQSNTHVRRKQSKDLPHKLFHAGKKVAHTARDAGRFVRSIFFGNPPSSKSSSTIQKKVTHISNASSETKIGKLAHKVGKFIKKHRKAIIIGAIVAVVIAGGIIILAASSQAAAGGALAGVGAGASSGAKAKPSTSGRSSQVTSSPSDNSVSQYFDPNRLTRDAVFQQAEQRAKEDRFQGLVYRQDQLQEAHERANQAFQDFQRNLINSIEPRDIGEAIQIATTITAATKAAGITGALLVGGATISTSDLAKRYGDKIQTFYEPAGQAFAQLHNMEVQNKQASYSKCIETGYQPKVEFHPTNPQVGSDRVAFVDRNNPDPNYQFTMEMPE